MPMPNQCKGSRATLPIFRMDWPIFVFFKLEMTWLIVLNLWWNCWPVPLNRTNNSAPPAPLLPPSPCPLCPSTLRSNVSTPPAPKETRRNNNNKSRNQRSLKRLIFSGGGGSGGGGGGGGGGPPEGAEEEGEEHVALELCSNRWANCRCNHAKKPSSVRAMRAQRRGRRPRRHLATGGGTRWWIGAPPPRPPAQFNQAVRLNRKSKSNQSNTRRIAAEEIPVGGRGGREGVGVMIYWPTSYRHFKAGLS